ncbi:MAG: PTS sugar transporter subunit IIA [Planctomycetes bacterium]|nr:PTS sugar transporter subunit IIA [Planctomycetota bacterium]
MLIAKTITPERLRVPLAATDKRGVIAELVDVLAATEALTNRDAALEAVLKRESERTTGIGYGLAIPHGKTDGCRSLVMAAGKPASPIDFQSLDKRPVTFVVLLISPPDQTAAHIQALAKISRLMNIEGFRADVEKAATAGDLHRVLVQYEAGEGST